MLNDSPLSLCSRDESYSLVNEIIMDHDTTPILEREDYNDLYSPSAWRPPSLLIPSRPRPSSPVEQFVERESYRPTRLPPPPPPPSPPAPIIIPLQTRNAMKTAQVWDDMVRLEPAYSSPTSSRSSNSIFDREVAQSDASMSTTGNDGDSVRCSSKPRASTIDETEEVGIIMDYGELSPSRRNFATEDLEQLRSSASFAHIHRSSPNSLSSLECKTLLQPCNSSVASGIEMAPRFHYPSRPRYPRRKDSWPSTNERLSDAKTLCRTPGKLSLWPITSDSFLRLSPEPSTPVEQSVFEDDDSVRHFPGLSSSRHSPLKSGKAVEKRGFRKSMSDSFRLVFCCSR